MGNSIFDGIDQYAEKGGGERNPLLSTKEALGEYVLEIKDLATPTGQDKQQFFISTVKVVESNNPARPVGSLATILFKPKAHNFHIKEIANYFSAVIGEPVRELSKEMLETAVGAGKDKVVGTKIKARVAMEDKFNGKTKEWEYTADGTPVSFPELRLAALENGFPPVKTAPPYVEQASAPKGKTARR